MLLSRILTAIVANSSMLIASESGRVSGTVPATTTTTTTTTTPAVSPSHVGSTPVALALDDILLLQDDPLRRYPRCPQELDHFWVLFEKAILAKDLDLLSKCLKISGKSY